MDEKRLARAIKRNAKREALRPKMEKVPAPEGLEELWSAIERGEHDGKHPDFWELGRVSMKKGAVLALYHLHQNGKLKF